MICIFSMCHSHLLCKWQLCLLLANILLLMPSFCIFHFYTPSWMSLHIYFEYKWNHETLSEKNTICHWEIMPAIYTVVGHELFFPSGMFSMSHGLSCLILWFVITCNFSHVWHGTWILLLSNLLAWLWFQWISCQVMDKVSATIKQLAK